MSNPFDNRQKYPIMEYVAKLENKVRWLEWEVTKSKVKMLWIGSIIGALLSTVGWTIARIAMGGK